MACSKILNRMPQQALTGVSNLHITKQNSACACTEDCQDGHTLT